MVLDPERMQLARQMFGGAAGSSPEMESRQRQARLVSGATMIASRSDCQCEVCKMLRLAIDSAIDEARKEVGSHA